MARYRLVIKESAAKEIERVGQKQDRQRIVERIRSLAENPRPFGCEKLSGRQELYRVRTGRYRIVYSILDQELVVSVVKVGDRKGVYRGAS
ncbi:MAG TPA: type II toxin-antitoxin system RelE/ParE family toxin [Thermoanaerobaculia bacterium]|nr:type II toxin-antitoxin system RelE/ParE family toxin [Thermoanaerobaculia bacterium]